VLASHLAKHVTKCPANLHVLEQQSQPYFVRDVNLGSDDEEEGGHAEHAAAAAEVEKEEEDKEEEKEEEGQAVSASINAQAGLDRSGARLPQGAALAALVERVRLACVACGVAVGAPLPEPLAGAYTRPLFSST
jgi:hypothetical protein